MALPYKPRQTPGQTGWPPPRVIATSVGDDACIVPGTPRQHERPRADMESAPTDGGTARGQTGNRTPNNKGDPYAQTDAVRGGLAAGAGAGGLPRGRPGRNGRDAGNRRAGHAGTGRRARAGHRRYRPCGPGRRRTVLHDPKKGQRAGRPDLRH